MLSVVARILNPRRRVEPRARSKQPSRPVTVNSIALNDDDDRALARSLAEALDEALALGRSHQTRTIATSASRIAHRHPQLTERLARLKLAEDNADAALNLIDACDERTASLRLLRCACLLQSGRQVEAQQDLSAWCHHSSAPAEARQLLALLEWEQGDLDAASIHLRDNLRANSPVMGDEKSLMLLMCLAAERGHHEQAAQWANRLRQTMWRRSSTPDVNIFIHCLGVRSNDTAVAPTTEQLGALATELLAAEPAIPAIVESLEIDFDPSAADMLAAGLEHGLDDFTARGATIEALVRLNILLDRPERAAQWIERGLAENPLSASLALLMKQLPRESAAPRATSRKRSAAA